MGLALCACTGPQVASAPPQDGKPVVAVYVVAHEKHTGIAIRRADIPAGLWPESRDFPQADYLEVGWGDREYYQALDPGLGTTLSAALFPTPSVLHVVGIRGPVAEYFQSNEVIEFGLPGDGFERLVRYIHDAHERAGAPATAPLGKGLYGDSQFYPAWETFHLFRTCNVWTARALRTAGLPVSDSITREGLMSQARAIGKVVNRPRPR
jgi:uncharacterized protein (TIGR02117 family)